MTSERSVDEWSRGGLAVGEFAKRRYEPMKKSHVDVIDQWNDGAIVATCATLADAYEAIRTLGQETRDGQWRYTLAPASHRLLELTDTSPSRG
jgi:hypothetical protein